MQSCIIYVQVRTVIKTGDIHNTEMRCSILVALH